MIGTQMGRHADERISAKFPMARNHLPRTGRLLLLVLVVLALVPGRLPALSEEAARERLIEAGWEAGPATEIVDRIARATGRVVAVFDHDNTLTCGDITEGNERNQPGLMRGLLDERRRLGTLPVEVPIEAAADPWAFYHDWTRRDPKVAYGWICTLLAGRTPAEVARMAAAYYDRFLKPAIFPEMRALITVLRELGVDVYIVSASAQHVVRAAAAQFGLPPDHVLGIRLRERDGRITPEIVQPISFSAGKTWYIQNFVGSFPRGNILVFGDSWRTDGHMLRFAASQGGFALLVNPPAELVPTLDAARVRHQPLPSKPRLDRE